MSLFRNLRNEWRMLKASPVKIFIPVFVTVIFGVLVWLSCDGITVVWKTSYLPSLCVPLWLMFSLWIITYIMFGLLISIGMACCLSAELWLKSVIGYVAALFWCPLTLLAGVGLCGVCSVVVSMAYTLYIMRIYGKISLSGVLCSLFIVIYEAYLLYFTVGFTIIN